MDNLSPAMKVELNDNGVYDVQYGDTEFNTIKVQGSCISCCYSMYVDDKLQCIYRLKPSECNECFDKCTADGLRLCPCCGNMPYIKTEPMEDYMRLTIVCSSTACGLRMSEYLNEMEVSDEDKLNEAFKRLKDKWNSRAPKYNYSHETGTLEKYMKPRYDK